MNLQDGEPFDVLVICTANICRSPMAEGLLRRTGPHARVSSAGFLRDGSPPAPDAAALCRPTLRGAVLVRPTP